MTYPFTRILSQGDAGLDVYRLQYALNAVGRYYLISSCHCETDGIFGPETKSDLMSFQTWDNITADGIFGNIISDHLVKRYNAGPVAIWGDTYYLIHINNNIFVF
ncbi:peptidoglycan-binding domain-containing protein [Thermoanaerobacterium sp. RBIITD]|uniref:peptidoglycan-binding domain-containing protein n=1 Tax=Thermoanaerobacterium sp. RBIITD TaxID=1550240 RepID=UPI000BB7D0A9|nr:peptidoglycan-binding domain-containing protein [Thermoanaerobacterium sp. RBIITD]SNX54775.1 Putative peptidoglycan binding domain-containing protein [Thermoanaerobacterium sp. RBIITD]